MWVHGLCWRRHFAAGCHPGHIRLPTYSPTHPLACSLTHPLTHPLTHSLTHSLPPPLPLCVRVQKRPPFASKCRAIMTSLGHVLPLKDYLLKPVQRILKYPLLLQTIETDLHRMLTQLQDKQQADDGKLQSSAAITAVRFPVSNPSSPTLPLSSHPPTHQSTFSHRHFLSLPPTPPPHSCGVCSQVQRVIAIVAEAKEHADRVR